MNLEKNYIYNMEEFMISKRKGDMSFLVIMKEILKVN
jgi:hypothetical protein